MFGYMIDNVVSVATIVAGLSAVIATMFAWRSANATKRTVSADLLLRLDDRMRSFDDVHTKLRGGVWSDGVTGPSSVEEWAQVEAYMGLFERIHVLIKDGLIDIRYVDRFYGYRYTNILKNPVIVNAKLKGSERGDWKHFIALGGKLSYEASDKD